MGFAVSWVALKADRSEALELLGLEATGEREDIPESPFTGAQLEDGWFLVFANDFAFAHNLPLQELSATRHLVSCSLEEHVMRSTAEEWRDGAQVWRVDHDPEHGLDHADVRGEPPETLSELISESAKRLKAEGGPNSPVDFHFDVPVELARAEVGFRHDRDVVSPDPVPFEVLEPAKGGAAQAASGGGCASVLVGLAILGTFLGHQLLR